MPQPKNESNRQEQLTPLWAGADVVAVVHHSIEEMIPCEITKLSGKVFNAPVRPDIVHSVVVWQLARRRAGTAKTKNRSEVAGSGRKIRPQKGTGRSRQGAITSPIFRGGGTVHGPVPRSYDYPLPKAVQVNGLRSMITSKMANGQLYVVQSAAISDAKTKNLINCMDKYGWTSALIVDDIPDDAEDGTEGVLTSMYRSAKSVEKVKPLNVEKLNVYDGLVFEKLVLTTTAVQRLEDRFSKYHFLF